MNIPKIKKTANTRRLYELDAFVEFEFKGNRYRTMTPIKETVVNSCHKGKQREVMELPSGRAIVFPYFSVVTELSEKIERNEKKK